MIYLDNAAHTPVEEYILRAFCDAAQGFPGNPSSHHRAGEAARQRWEQAVQAIAAALGVQPDEIVLTGGATESNNLAIKGLCEKNRKYGRHIVTTALEHASVSGPLAVLAAQGYEVERAPLGEDGSVDLEALRDMLRQDTILVSICAVDSEVGIRQPLRAIAQLTAGLPHCAFHTDATQAVGKVPLDLESIAAVSLTAHKLHGPTGVGALVLRRGTLLEPQMHGGLSDTPWRSGTPALALAAALQATLTLAAKHQDASFARVSVLNRQLRAGLAKMPGVRINSPQDASPYIVNISVPGVRTEAVQSALSQRDIHVATKSACCAPNTMSLPVYALTGDKRAALSTLRFSLSRHTTAQEIEGLLAALPQAIAIVKESK